MINYINETGTLFGTTDCIGIGNRKPEIVYGKQAQKLREVREMSIEDLSKALGIKKDLIEGIEATKKGMTEEVMAKYMSYFGVEKEYFYDMELNVCICTPTQVLKTYNSAKECEDAFNFIKKEFIRGQEEGTRNFSMFIDFSKEV